MGVSGGAVQGRSGPSKLPRGCDIGKVDGWAVLTRAGLADRGEELNVERQRRGRDRCSDQDVSIHEMRCRIMHVLLTFDQLNARAELLEGSHLYLSTGKTRGYARISPSLPNFATDELREAESRLHLGQRGIEAAAHKLQAPAGLGELAALPGAARGALTNVLPAGTLGVGVGDGRLVCDRKMIPDIDEQPIAAILVDGVAIIGSKHDAAVSKLGPAFGALNKAAWQPRSGRAPPRPLAGTTKSRSFGQDEGVLLRGTHCKGPLKLSSGLRSARKNNNAAEHRRTRRQLRSSDMQKQGADDAAKPQESIAFSARAPNLQLADQRECQSAWRGGGTSFYDSCEPLARPGRPAWARRGSTQILGADCLVPGATDMIPHQRRHAAASHATAVERMSPKELQARLRRTSAQSTAGHSRRVRYLAELQKVDEMVAKRADNVEASIGAIFGIRLRPDLPPFLSQGPHAGPRPPATARAATARGAATAPAGAHPRPADLRRRFSGAPRLAMAARGWPASDGRQGRKAALHWPGFAEVLAAAVSPSPPPHKPAGAAGPAGGARHLFPRLPGAAADEDADDAPLVAAAGATAASAPARAQHAAPPPVRLAPILPACSAAAADCAAPCAAAAPTGGLFGALLRGGARAPAELGDVDFCVSDGSTKATMPPLPCWLRKRMVRAALQSRGAPRPTPRARPPSRSPFEAGWPDDRADREARRTKLQRMKEYCRSRPDTGSTRRPDTGSTGRPDSGPAGPLARQLSESSADLGAWPSTPPGTRRAGPAATAGLLRAPEALPVVVSVAAPAECGGRGARLPDLAGEHCDRPSAPELLTPGTSTCPSSARRRSKRASFAEEVGPADGAKSEPVQPGPADCAKSEPVRRMAARLTPVGSPGGQRRMCNKQLLRTSSSPSGFRAYSSRTSFRGGAATAQPKLPQQRPPWRRRRGESLAQRMQRHKHAAEGTPHNSMASGSPWGQGTIFKSDVKGANFRDRFRMSVHRPLSDDIGDTAAQKAAVRRRRSKMVQTTEADRHLEGEALWRSVFQKVQDDGQVHHDDLRSALELAGFRTPDQGWVDDVYYTIRPSPSTARSARTTSCSSSAHTPCGRSRPTSRLSGRPTRTGPTSWRGPSSATSSRVSA
ncbi:unnamed protein product [Prorocentrum cordatum]|uniref:Uncharacterized protein n=1 Tax=Prorocentrum cordatum TaxID=2364126 RepID=A0ABN9UYH5_9DINO|nr:unnamed protein product [Polarella glacialis]